MPEFAPLFSPGIHAVTEAALELAAVTACSGSVRRPVLFAQLGQWLTLLRARGTAGRCWLDGSFLTTKPEPSDIDLVIFPNWAANPTPTVQAELRNLLDNPLVKAQYGLDVYVVLPGSPKEMEMTSYWRGWYGFCRDGVTAKGIAEVTL